MEPVVIASLRRPVKLKCRILRGENALKHMGWMRIYSFQFLMSPFGKPAIWYVFAPASDVVAAGGNGNEGLPL